jgi:hypothetical protein
VELKYRHLETALATVLDIKKDGTRTFRARLRYLRNIGLPSIVGPGKGKTISYTPVHALEVLLALELQNVGQAPAAAAALAGRIVSQYDDGDARELLALIEPSTASRALSVKFYFGVAMFAEHMNNMNILPPVFSLINVSHFANQINAALRHATESR